MVKIYHPSKKNTINNVLNLEELAINFETPEDLYIAAEEEYEQGNQFEKLLRDVGKLKQLSIIDLQVLAGEKTRREAADELSIKYDTYRKRLYRKIEEIRKNNNPPHHT